MLGAVQMGETLDCGGCHGSVADPSTLSGVHPYHLESVGAHCDECHAATASGSSAIGDPTMHVDGQIETEFPSGMVYSEGTCTGTCHGAAHDGASWTDGKFHPAGWDAPDQHGVAAKFQVQQCTRCHGADLTGGTANTSCDSCHQQGWRTDCTYCHGGADDTSGAPPVDIDGTDDRIAFDAHKTLVQEVDHAAWDCAQCHAKPTDVLSVGHLFLGDATPGAAELTFAAGLSPAGHYDGDGSCSNLYCHGNGAGTLGSVTAGTPPAAA